MCERDDDESQENKQPFIPIRILIYSFQLFPRNKRIFLPIFTLTTLPLSFLLFSFSLSACPIKAHIFHVEALASFAPTRFEARQLWKESRDDAVSLLHLKLSYFLPCYILSLLAATTAVNSTYFSLHGKRFGLHAAASLVKLTWKRVFVTTICIYGVTVLYSQVIFLVTILMGSTPVSVLLVWALGSGFEIYLMTVLGVGLVVSILEERFGFVAVRVGLGLMEGMRICGWVLSGCFVLISGLIGWRWEKLTVDVQDLEKQKWTAVMGSWEKMGLICLYGFTVLWSYVVTTIFYCECRKRHCIRTENDIHEVTV